MIVQFILFICFNQALAGKTNPSIVELPILGKVEGHYGESLNGHKFYAFEGVPYAQAPLGQRRFKAPMPLKPWSGVWQAKTVYKCLQNFQYTPEGQDPVIGDEDCLYLNIYSPNLSKNANLDVVVYIHGGAFMFFYLDNGPRYIMNENVVYVNINYRLGPIGFLSTESNLVPGNNGFKDQILALKWIKTYIKNFGGNPESITMSGTSAGGASVHLHYLSPKSKGLFTRGISQSGTALNPWVLMEKPLEKSKKLAANLGCTTEDIEKMVNCLRKRPARQIVKQVKAFQPWLYNPFSPFGIVVDSWSSDPVLPEHPYQLLKAGKVQDLAWIASETNFEGLYPASDFLAKDEYLDHIEKNWNQLLPFILDYNYTVHPKLHEDVSQMIHHKFLKDQKLTRKNFPGFVDVLSHRLFINGIHKSVQMQSSVVESPVYFYYYTYRGAQSWHQDLIGYHEDFGAAHAEDTSFFLSSTVNSSSTPEDRKMIDFFVQAFTSYAKTGKPKTLVDWKPVSKNRNDIVEGLKIDSPSKLSFEKIEVKDEKFWNSLPFMEDEKLVDFEDKDEL